MEEEELEVEEEMEAEVEMGLFNLLSSRLIWVVDVEMETEVEVVLI